MRHYEATKPRKWKLIEASRNLISYIFGNFPVTYYYTMSFLQYCCRTGPLFLIRGSLKSMRDKKFVHSSHKVLYQGFQFIKERAYDAEFGFNLLEYPEAAIATIEQIIATAKPMKENSRLYHSSPLGVQVCKKLQKLFLRWNISGMWRILIHLSCCGQKEQKLCWKNVSGLCLKMAASRIGANQILYWMANRNSLKPPIRN